MPQVRVGMKGRTVVSDEFFKQSISGASWWRSWLCKISSSQLLSALRTKEGRSKGYSSFSSLIRFWLESDLSQWPHVNLKKVPVSIPISFKLNRFLNLKQLNK